VAELQLCWCHRAYYGVQHINDSDPANPFDYQLGLSSFGRDNLVVSPAVGVEWDFADRWSVTAVPRADVLLGHDSTVAVTAVILFSYSWYL
jgi:hypothetical protein